MRIETRDSESGEIVAVEIADLSEDHLSRLTNESVTDEQLDQLLDNMELSADAKALLSDVKAATIKVGQQIVRVGKRIIEIVLAIVKQYPNVAFGAVLGMLVGLLISAIPILGALLGALVVPIAIAFGLIHGYVEDLRNKAVDRKIREAVGMFEALNGQVTA